MWRVRISIRRVVVLQPPAKARKLQSADDAKALVRLSQKESRTAVSNKEVINHCQW